jgi:hypothetical protein
VAAYEIDGGVKKVGRCRGLSLLVGEARPRVPTATSLSLPIFEHVAPKVIAGSKGRTLLVFVGNPFSHTHPSSIIARIPIT